MLELPDTATCSRCGSAAHVPRQSVDENAATGRLSGFDQSWEAGYWYTIICPNCGRVELQLQSSSPATPHNRIQ